MFRNKLDCILTSLLSMTRTDVAENLFGSKDPCMIFSAQSV